MWSKWFLGVGAFDSGHGAFAAVLMVSSLLSIGYLVPVFGRAFLAEPASQEGGNLERAHPLVVLPPVLTAIGCVVLFFGAERLHTLLAGI